jgi:hypothetical protein
VDEGGALSCGERLRVSKVVPRRRGRMRVRRVAHKVAASGGECPRSCRGAGGGAGMQGAGERRVAHKVAASGCECPRSAEG